MSAASSAIASRPERILPKIGFAGTGWIGRARLEAMLESGIGEATAIFDPSAENAGRALDCATGARLARSFDELISMDLDGIVIATPSAMHAEQSIAALKRGCAVFCQKPLARTAQETRAVIEAARAANHL